MPRQNKEECNINRLMIIGNLTRDPELRTTNNGKDVCNFTVAVNKRRNQDGNQPEADFFRVTVWNELAKNCGQYLAKGKKVCVIGPVSVKTYQAQDGSTRANMEVEGREVEFLTPKGEAGEATTYAAPEASSATSGTPAGFTPVETDDLPF